MMPDGRLAYARPSDCEPLHFRLHSPRRPAPCLVALALALAGSLPAQTPQPDAPSPSARPYILLDVIPTDPQDHPVPGLTQQDFHACDGDIYRWR